MYEEKNCYILNNVQYVSASFANFTVLWLRPLQKWIYIPVLGSVSVFCLYEFLSCFYYRLQIFFVSLAAFHLSVSYPFTVYDLVKLWSAAALVTDRPPAPTQTNQKYY